VLLTPDALQAACCLQLGSEAVMVSGDADFCRLDGLQLRLIRSTMQWLDERE
jgi:hypothetical protein